MRVVAVDVGSVKSNNFAWAGLDLPDRRPVGKGGSDPEGAAAAVLETLVAGVPVALGFEAPLMVPVPNEWKRLGKQREGDTTDGQSRAWSAAPGSSVLATGLVQIAWVLGRIGSEVAGLRCTTRPTAWMAGQASLFVWEAFVSGTGKPVPSEINQHAADAAAAAATFADRVEQKTLNESDVCCAPASSLNLAAAATMHAGLTIAGDELRDEVRVYRTPGALHTAGD